MKRDGRPPVGKTAPCRAKLRHVRYCKLMSAMINHDRNVQTAIQWPTSSTFVVYHRNKKQPYTVWAHCPYCGESIIPKAART